MSVFKRGKWWWMDAVVNGNRYRESLGTTDGRNAPSLERERIAQIKDRAPDPSKRSKFFGSTDINAAMEAYVSERRAQVSPRMVAYWREQARPLIKSQAFKGVKLNKISPAHIAAYQNERIDAGKAPKTINGEVSVLRQLLKHARLWYRFQEDYKPIPNTKPPAGRALTIDEQMILFETARSRPDWLYAYTAATLSFYCGMRTCEIKSLRWKHIDWSSGVIEIRRSKTPAGWRNPTMNEVCRTALSELYAKASIINASEPEHFTFPWHGREQKIDPTKPITSWRTAWRSILKAAGLNSVRFHDGRHTAITTLAEKGLADWVIQAQVGHVDPQMMKTYSHIRRRALDEAAAALEPSFVRKVQSEEGRIH
ncbi:MAG TPA: site-specific integrase [Pyrinomonadaceae bacterium]|jgi:integrase